MSLGQIITALEAADPTAIMPLGFHNPHSYRGDYYDLAFEPATDITIGEVLAAARSALDTTYQGYKGGDFTMHEYTDCWLATYGDCGETIGPIFLSLLIANARPAAPVVGEQPHA